jgi:hypothetical protein
LECAGPAALFKPLGLIATEFEIKHRNTGNWKKALLGLLKLLGLSRLNFK